jgi:hypothetical protein
MNRKKHKKTYLKILLKIKEKTIKKTKITDNPDPIPKVAEKNKLKFSNIKTPILF